MLQFNTASMWGSCWNTTEGKSLFRTEGIWGQDGISFDIFPEDALWPCSPGLARSCLNSFVLKVIVLLKHTDDDMHFMGEFTSPEFLVITEKHGRYSEWKNAHETQQAMRKSLTVERQQHFLDMLMEADPYILALDS